MAELKPCPFCGYDAELINGDDYHWVSCPNCGADTMGSEDKEKAIEAWNRRMRDGERICPFDGHMVVCDSDCDRCDYAKMGGGLKMAKFIEVTTLDGAKRLINTAWIEEIWEGDNAAIYFAFQAENMVDQDCMVVMESYEEIKRKVWGC